MNIGAIINKHEHYSSHNFPKTLSHTRELKGMRIDSTQLSEEIASMERKQIEEEKVQANFIETLNKSAEQTKRDLELTEIAKRVKELKGRVRRGKRHGDQNGV